MKLDRPYVPMIIRVAVAERQCREAGKQHAIPPPAWRESDRLSYMLGLLFDNEKAELHHRPALCNRERYEHKGRTYYRPPANDPEYLVYLTEAEHDIETRVRGAGAQLSDLGQLRKAKRREKKEARQLAEINRARCFPAGAFGQASKKRKWPSRPFPKAKAKRKMRSRPWSSRAKTS
jgi:hypothetical protein